MAKSDFLLGRVVDKQQQGLGSPWITSLHEFPSTMAQNFYIALLAFVSCFVVTVVVSLFTKPRPPEELRGLVYSLTKFPEETGVSWYRKPAPVAVLVIAMLLALNFWFR